MPEAFQLTVAVAPSSAAFASLGADGAVDGRGANRGAFVVEGTPARVALSYDGSRIAAATIERQIYVLNRSGELRWAAETPDEVAALRLDATGRSVVVGFTAGRVARLGWA